MPRKKKIDNDALIKMAGEGVPQDEIMRKMGFKTSSQLKVAYFNALVESGQARALKTSRTGGGKAVDTTVSVGKRGSLVISKNLVEHIGIDPEKKYELRQSFGGGFSLRPVL